MLALLFALIALAGPVAALGAQVPTRPDTTRRPAAGDTVRRPTPADTGRARRDTVRTAVPIPPRADSARTDSVRGIPDTTRAKQRRDSIQAPLAGAELPSEVRVGHVLRWTRDSIFASGALTLADLLDRVPGITTYRTGWLASAQTAAYLGDFRRVRIFRDGVELDAVDPRNGGVPELLDLQLWQADEIVIERVADEVRVHVRTWTTRNTTAYTRVDIATGDEDTNAYRGYYGKRWGNGVALQVGAQQYGTGTRNRLGGGGDALNAMLRLGWARGKWTVDGQLNRLDRSRDLTVSVDRDSLLAAVDARRSDGYFRVAWSDPDRGGPWAQAIASTTSLSLNGTGVARLDSTLSFTRGSAARTPVTRIVQATDSVFDADSAASRAQYVLTGGYTLGPVRLSVADRLRATNGSSYNTPSARATFDRGWLSVAAYGEWGAVGGVRVDTASLTTRTRYPLTIVDSTKRDTSVVVTTTERDTVVERPDQLRGVVVSPDRWSRLDLTARLSPLSWLAIQGSISRETRESFQAVVVDTVPNETARFDFLSRGKPSATTLQAEVAARLGGTWVSAGVVRRGATELAVPAVYAISDSSALVAEGSTSGVLLGAQGKLYKDVYVDLNAVSWSSSGRYRPQYQARVELGVATNWLGRFPSGNLGIHAALVDEYRSRVQFLLPVATAGAEGTASGSLADLCGQTGARCAPASNMLTAMLEIRIQKGTLWYQLRNALNREYQLVPGFTMPRPISVYGVRWEFWN